MLWYPYVQMKTMKMPFEVVDAKGVYIHTKEKPMIDSVSSWWSTIHGYCHPALNAAAKAQIDQFSHVMLGGLVHDPAKALADRLQEILPGDLNHVFFSDSGSVGVEVALKMAIQFYNNAGKVEKREIIGLKEAYHGDTFKAMAVGDDEDYHKAFPDKSDVHHIPIDLGALEDLLSQRHDKIAALIVEPLLQGAAGMKIHEVDFLKGASALCKAYDVLLIFDEVATGFGRTGHLFVADLVLPDIIVLGKALTGGYIGHAATVASDRVFEGFYSDDPSKALMHGPTFMGNPLACRVALAGIDVFMKEDYMEKIKQIEGLLQAELLEFKSPLVKDIRVIGACGCIEVFDPQVLEGFTEFAYEQGVWNRPFLNFMYTMPPYIIKPEELMTIINTFKKWLRLKEGQND